VRSIRIRCFSLLVALAAFVPTYAQSNPQTGQPNQPTTTETLEAGETDAFEPKRKLIDWNEFEGKNFTLRVGGGFLVDYASFAQDDTSKEQITVQSKYQFRDGRLLLKGKFKFIRSRSVTWSAGIMWNAATHSWQFRQSGIMVSLPEIWGSVFVGRTKEGISMNKIMVGYHGWTSERATINDATLPILADGVKWLGYSKRINLVWNLGYYGDWLSKNLAFSTYRRQVVGRAAWVKGTEPTSRSLFHAGVGFRYGKPEDGKIQLRSRPEVYPSPYFIDTGFFAAKDTRMIVPEVYYRFGPWIVGSEYMIQKANAPASGNPVFHGGEVLFAWNLTGETRAYNVRCGCFEAVSPRRTVFERGRGAWEFVTRFSRTDLDSGALRGGKFWRLTPMMNWHMSDHVRLEFSYGVGKLDRFGLNGVTQFFQTRLQLSL
jgi:phosphate-selective porin OprO/OprP